MHVFYNAKEKRLMNPEEFSQAMTAKYNRSGFVGMHIDPSQLNQSRNNAAGDYSSADLAYQYATDRLTYIRQRYVEQSFYTVAPADFMNVVVGEGAWSQQIITQASIQTAGGFKQGKLNTGAHNAKLNTADAAITPIATYVQNWALATEYTLFDVNQALFTGAWDPVEAKQKARKRDYDLGIQEVAFLGDVADETHFPGLLTNTAISANTNRIGAAISGMTAGQFAAFVAGIVGDFLTNCNYTAMPNKLTIPTDDWAGLATPVSYSFPNISMIEYLGNAFKAVVSGGVELLPLAYGIPANNSTVTGLNKHVYCLYHDDIDTLFMEVPVAFTVTAAGTYNNFSFQDAAYCQYTGVTILKPLEVMYFTF